VLTPRHAAGKEEHLITVNQRLYLKRRFSQPSSLEITQKRTRRLRNYAVHQWRQLSSVETDQLHTSNVPPRFLVKENQVCACCQRTGARTGHQGTACKLTDAYAFQVFGGLLLNQMRQQRRDPCHDPRAKLSAACTYHDDLIQQDALDRFDALHPFGTDPAFNQSSHLYNPVLVDCAGDYYNTTPAAEEVSAFGLPYAFFPRPLIGWKLGFPVIFQVGPHCFHGGFTAFISWHFAST
jgi:hypothetical protein